MYPLVTLDTRVIFCAVHVIPREFNIKLREPRALFSLLITRY